jgi:hypothetical protein
LLCNCLIAIDDFDEENVSERAVRHAVWMLRVA